MWTYSWRDLSLARVAIVSNAAGRFEVMVGEAILRGAGRESRTCGGEVGPSTALLQITSSLLQLTLLKSILWKSVSIALFT